ncbi:uncharacterized protein EDB91DRAFT_398562 [Suillus paluster]|uniref:uncharacterized protein n=1 Tax=Suillus paluster TaxID=48578 RepID=UPI001B886AAB|nr:uncharacterized protein EDB91DRAFT_398562 [Suillus paluster]KAG1739207.1 hypothetical protein EDB91DRAFT_398562 [Suillus paluster]
MARPRRSSSQSGSKAGKPLKQNSSKQYASAEVAGAARTKEPFTQETVSYAGLHRKSGYWEVCVRSAQTSVSRSVSSLCQRYPRVTGGGLSALQPPKVCLPAVLPDHLIPPPSLVCPPPPSLRAVSFVALHLSRCAPSPSLRATSLVARCLSRLCATFLIACSPSRHPLLFARRLPRCQPPILEPWAPHHSVPSFDCPIFPAYCGA